jgi:hypothetical protein
VLSPRATVAREPEIKFDPELLEAQASQVPFEVTAEWLAERSASNLDLTPAQYLDAIFNADECVCVCPLKMHKGEIYTPGDAKDAARLDRLIQPNIDGCWFVANPVNGQEVNGSWRSEANLAAYHHLLLESDKAPRDLWLRAVVQIELPILSITESGNKSLHALVRIPATDKASFDEFVGKRKASMVRLGMDPAAIRAVQLTRLPGVTRNDNSRCQRLLYLNPNADSTPILRRGPWTPLF